MIFEQNFRKRVTIFQNLILSQRTNMNIIEFPCVKNEKLVFERILKNKIKMEEQMVRPRQKVIRWAQMSYEQKSKPTEENKKNCKPE